MQPSDISFHTPEDWNYLNIVGSEITAGTQIIGTERDLPVEDPLFIEDTRQSAYLKPDAFKGMSINCQRCRMVLCKTKTIYHQYKPKQCKICKEDVVFSCDRCNKTFKSLSSCHTHLRLVCGKPRRFVCPVCNFKTHYPHVLKDHSRKVHADI